MFIQSADLVKAKLGDISRINVYGQEKEPATYRLAKMNLALRGISHHLGGEADSTFTHDLHKGLYFNYIMANPPFNLKGWYDENLKNDSRWADYVTPPESNANYAWILHILSHLKAADGVAGFLLANGALGDSDTLEIRKRLIQNDKVEAIVILPRELFITTDISVTLWILNQNKKGGSYHGRNLRNREHEILAIRPVEFDVFSRILNMPKVNAGTIEYNSMMEYLTVSGMSLTELVTMSDEYYGAVKTKIQNLSKSNNLFNSLDRCRQLIKSNAAGSNILRYILLKMRHRIMRYQIADRPNNWISYLSLWNECIPFDKMPFDASLVYHNPSLFDVFSCISSKGREHEILSRKIRINTEQNVKLFTPIKDVEYIGNVQELANKFNTLLISKHVPVRSLVIEKDNVYIKGYEADTVTIINDLISRVGNGLTGYRNAMGTWLQETPTVDCEEKESILLDMFSKYDLALIYGAAGTGKTTLIKHLSSYFADSSKLFLANTNPAKENLRRQIKVSNSEFSTIASCSPLVNGNNYDIVFIDECSTVDNAAMKELLKKLNCRLLVLVGDVYQIRSIKFGNWFSLARYFLPSNIVYELNTPYRSKHSSMVELWNKVRSLDERTEEYIAIQHYASELDDSIFVREDSDEIILCLNYDGLYGINNINRFLQNDNQSPAVYWDSWIYKVGDPVIFSENNRFYPTLYNNLKGWIRHIKKETAAIQFDIEVDMALTEFAAMAAGFDLLECDVPGHSLIRFTVDHYIDDDGREKNSREVVPFQVAYAISIHKAQGLEYNSVKVVVTNEIEEQITHNIFYTAITRACKNLKIYWTPETQHKVLTEMKPLSCKSDAFVISNKYNIPITNRNG